MSDDDPFPSPTYINDDPPDTPISSGGDIYGDSRVNTFFSYLKK
jgi:hypothetical protein